MLAQLPQAAPADYGTWLIVLVGFTVFCHYARQIWLSFFPLQKDGERYVTHDQFNAFRTEVDVRLSGFSRDFGGRLEKMDTYIHDAFHRSANFQQAQATSLAELKGMFNVMFGAAKAFPVPEPIGVNREA